MVYEQEATKRERGGDEKSFAEKCLWNRQSVDRNLQSELANGHQEDGGSGVSGERSTSLRESERQFTIADEEENDEQADEGSKAFRSIIGHPPSANGPITELEEGGSIDDPLSQSQSTLAKDEVRQALEGGDDEMIPCLVDRLFSCTIDLLFCAGFTVPESVRGQDGSGEKINVS